MRIFLGGNSNGKLQKTESKAEDLRRQAEAARKAETAALVADIRAKMSKYGITLADLGGAAKKPATRKAGAAKYRNPASGATWTGRGRPPRWLADEVAKGKKRDDFLVG